MMKINDVIIKHDQRADELRAEAKETDDKLVAQMNLELADNHEIMSGWLRELIALKEQTRWIPVEERFPSEQDGYYVLLSFENFDIPEIGRYEIDKNGDGAFYAGDDDESLLSYDLIVNAWRRLPECYKEDLT